MVLRELALLPFYWAGLSAMIELMFALMSVLALYAVVFIPLCAAAHYDVFGCWPKTWQEWLFVWLDPEP